MPLFIIIDPRGNIPLFLSVMAMLLVMVAVQMFMNGMKAFLAGDPAH